MKPLELINQIKLRQWRKQGVWEDKAWVICEHIRQQGLKISELKKQVNYYKEVLNAKSYRP